MTLQNLISTGESFVFVLTCIILHRLWKVTHIALFTPLKHVPGPVYAKWTNLRLKYEVIRGRRCHYIHNMHARYGPIVRISPTEIAVSDLTSFRTIHKIGNNFKKSPWYINFTQSESPGIFGMTDFADHAARRRLFAQSFSKTSLLRYESTVRSKVEIAIAKIERDARTSKADILKWLTFMATDVMGQLSFGQSFNMLEQEQKTQYIRDLETVMMISGMNAEMGLALKVLPLPGVRQSAQIRSRLDSYGRLAVENLKVNVRADTGSSITGLFSKFLSGKNDQPLPDNIIAEEASNLIVAGSDTTAITLTYLVWAVLHERNREVGEKLVTEIERLPKDADINIILGLTYLHSVVNETLRLYGAAPGSLPRMVPQGGTVLNDFFLPAGTIVSTQAYTMHRDPKYFKDPERFIPERWDNPSQEMKDAFTPYGVGSRVCLGLHLATLELFMGAFLFFKTCPNAKIHSTTTDNDMEIENHFLIAPRAHRCEITLPDDHFT